MSHRNGLWLIVVMIGLLLLVTSSSLLQTGPANQPSPKEVQITEKDGACGSAVGLDVGDTLVLILEGNPSTGYAWEVGFYVPEVIKPDGEPVFRTVSDLVGTGGSYTFRFLAVGEGQVALRLIYHRAWEKNVPELKMCEVNVNVMPQLND